jgi:hypothetical protein
LWYQWWMLTCRSCRDTKWVCEDHPDKPGVGMHGCQCGAAAMPCARCAPDSDWDNPPGMSDVFTSVLHVASKKLN